MAFLGMRKWSTPIVRPLWPFMIGAGIVTYGLYKLQEAGVRSETYRNDPRNPYAAQIARESIH